MSFSHNFLQFIVLVPNFLTIFIVVFSDISVNLSSFRFILGLSSSKYLQQYFLVIMLRSSQSISHTAPTVTRIHDLSSARCSISTISSPTNTKCLLALNTNSSSSTALSAIVPATPYIPRSISSISKSPTPEKWTLSSSEEIKSLISQNVFDTP
jgi:hypothetical protein